MIYDLVYSKKKKNQVTKNAFQRERYEKEMILPDVTVKKKP